MRREELDAIKNVEAFRPLSVAAADQLALALSPVRPADGDVVVRQGEPAEDMFLIGSGVFDADVDGQRVRTMNQGGHFGEIGLLFGVPRRQDFLRASTGNSTSNEAIRAIADQRLAPAGYINLPRMRRTLTSPPSFNAAA
ncbi:MAG TPA: cyclic nucleotide-binding domain-containing protein [Mycobacterium sp.]|nr:cyclic nucleotide-binding domain-containing protein [Mycobacterium sp.]HTX95363.1 cyclic nucleotide-binding domain-containing protein [Mycobacterium sp.]